MDLLTEITCQELTNDGGIDLKYNDNGTHSLNIFRKFATFFIVNFCICNNTFIINELTLLHIMSLACNF